MTVEVLRSGRRRRLAARTRDPALRALLETPEPDPRTPLDELRLLAVDVETTGLDARRDRLLSVGFVPVDGRDVVLGGARSAVVRPDPGRAPVRDARPGSARDTGVGQSAVLHGLTDDVVASGVPVAEVLDALFEALRGRVLLAHFARMETSFLGLACERLHGVRPPVRVVDTMTLHERVLLADTGPLPGPDALRLWSARARYGLPASRSHDALSDALACAELYLAQTRELAAGATLRLADVRAA